MKFAIIGVVLLLLIAGGVGGAAFMGVINIPGITPAKPKPKQEAKKEVKPAPKPQPTDESASDKKPTKVAKKDDKPKATVDPAKGASTVAELWNEMDTAKLVAITKDWKDNDLVPILLKMDEAKVTEYLGQIDPKKSSSLSKAIGKQASIVEVPEAAAG